MRNNWIINQFGIKRRITYGSLGVVVFTQAADKRFKDFNDSLRFDYRLAEQDIEGSIGWSKALVMLVY